MAVFDYVLKLVEKKLDRPVLLPLSVFHRLPAPPPATVTAATLHSPLDCVVVPWVHVSRARGGQLCDLLYNHYKHDLALVHLAEDLRVEPTCLPSGEAARELQTQLAVWSAINTDIPVSPDRPHTETGGDNWGLVVARLSTLHTHSCDICVPSFSPGLAVSRLQQTELRPHSMPHALLRMAALIPTPNVQMQSVSAKLDSLRIVEVAVRERLRQGPRRKVDRPALLPLSVFHRLPAPPRARVMMATIQGRLASVVGGVAPQYVSSWLLTISIILCLLVTSRCTEKLLQPSETLRSKLEPPVLLVPLTVFHSRPAPPPPPPRPARATAATLRHQLACVTELLPSLFPPGSSPAASSRRALAFKLARASVYNFHRQLQDNVGWGHVTLGSITLLTSFRKIKAGETCTDTADCVSQSTCDSNSDKCKCNSGYTAGWTDLCIADGAVGGACLPDSKCTASTSVCESSTCIVNGAVGGACLSDSTCTASTSVCESAVCKIKAGVTCTDTNECVSQSTCDSDSDKCTCNNGYTAGWTDLCSGYLNVIFNVLLIFSLTNVSLTVFVLIVFEEVADGAVGGVCLSGSTCTASTSVCESAVCKIKAGETCTDTKECVSQSTCDSDKCACATDYPKTPAGLCIADGAVGGACLSDSTCTDSTSVCELSTCKIKAGETCSATIECVSQSTCDSEECTCNSGYTETSTGLCSRPMASSQEVASGGRGCCWLPYAETDAETRDSLRGRGEGACYEQCRR
ncbi:hypothetical protein C0Q70_14510 [Pomacea canaliculata]|uniref:EGF-like domain-containing protein n=1 Tax=Pomacea canaliculata TaxID=400727 RepID=A0A2T7NS88_POMCA|nr:hypothetical protein C0Q70_14510 [Pomacea canaliculata]